MKRFACSHGASEYKEANVLKTDGQSARHTSENSLVCKMDRAEAVRKGDRWEQTKENGNDGKGSGEKK